MVERFNIVCKPLVTGQTLITLYLHLYLLTLKDMDTHFVLYFYSCLDTLNTYTTFNKSKIQVDFCGTGYMSIMALEAAPSLYFLIL
jgi:hypothetical protein